MSDFVTVIHETTEVANVVKEVVEVVLVVEQGLTGATGATGAAGADGGATTPLYFNYGDATPAILFTPGEDQVIKTISMPVLIPFNGTGAKVSIGTDADPELLIEEDESNLTVTSNYETSPIQTISAGTPVKAFITPGLGATTGRCMVLIEYAIA